MSARKAGTARHPMGLHLKWCGPISLSLTEQDLGADLKQTIVRLVDDLDGTDAAESITFGLDSVQYAIDLSEVNAKELREVFGRYVDAGTKVSRRIEARNAAGTLTFAERRDANQAIRAWAYDNGIDLRTRGRIPGDVVAKYEAARR